MIPVKCSTAVFFPPRADIGLLGLSMIETWGEGPVQEGKQGPGPHAKKSVLQVNAYIPAIW